jgi:RNA polymerase sigma-70 factor (ECF subfamily)
LNESRTSGDEKTVTISFAMAPDRDLDRGLEEAPTLHARLADGDPTAVDETYRLHHAALRAFANRYLGDAFAAEDLVHDVFVALPSAMRRFRGDSSLRTFLIAIAVKRAYKHVRSATRRRAALARLAEQPERTTRGPDAVLDDARMADALYRALDRLPRDQRTAFVLCEVDQMTAGEAAAIVDAPEATVRTRLFHARKKLRELLQEIAP